MTMLKNLYALFVGLAILIIGLSVAVVNFKQKVMTNFSVSR